MSEIARRDVRSLSVDERADMAFKLFKDWSVKGKSMASLARQHNITPHAVKLLIEEHAAVERVMNGDATRQAAIRAYSYVQEKAVEIMEDPDNPVLVRAQAPQTFIQAQTRKDKIQGNESPSLNVNVNARSTLDKLKAAMQDTGVSPADLATMGEEELVVDAEDADVSDDDWDNERG